MAEYLTSFRGEVSRLVRRELKKTFAQLKAENVKLKKHVADLRKKMAGLQKANRYIEKETKYVARLREEKEAASENPQIDRMRIKGSAIRKLREKLGISQAELAALLGVTGQTIYQWERRQNESLRRLRNDSKIALLEIRKMGKKQVLAKLEAM
ncbi:MAG TPA: helix-turn-helix domain-containing protein [Phycisphaerae bacterium]|nr:helix-turn-helix domain-containing protein [Phycisphaerae bacterium]HPS52943.1 helix-turn-helix domain-containing protein [Phycisphaerae bacterium]